MSDEKTREAFEALTRVEAFIRECEADDADNEQNREVSSLLQECHFSIRPALEQAAQRQGGEAEPREFWVLFDARADEKFIKKDPEGGGLAFFDNERDAARAKENHAGTDYKKVTYYTAPKQAGEPVAWIVRRYDECVGICPDRDEADRLASAMNAEVYPIYTAPQTQPDWVPKGWNIEKMEPSTAHPDSIRIDAPGDHHCIIDRTTKRPEHHPVKMLFNLAQALIRNPTRPQPPEGE